MRQLSPLEKRARKTRNPGRIVTVGTGKYVRTPEMYNSRRGKIAWNKGKKCPSTTGPNHGAWVGDSAVYGTKHQYLGRHFGKAKKCENINCFYPRKNASRGWVRSAKKYEWALVRGRSYSRDRKDYLRLCASCHRRYDSGHSEINGVPMIFKTI